MGAQEFPANPPLTRVVDTADLLSRASITDLDHRLAALEDDHIQARLVTLRRLDYGLDLADLGHQLLERWQGDGNTIEDGQLLFLIEAQNNTAAVVVSNDLLDQLPASLLSSTGTSTMGLPLRPAIAKPQLMALTVWPPCSGMAKIRAHPNSSNDWRWNRTCPAGMKPNPAMP